MQYRCQVLGPASAEWNDFVGTAAADDLDLSDAHHSLYRLAGLSPARWLITCVDFVVRENARRMVVYAFDRDSAGVGTHTDLLDVAEAQGDLPVVAFELDGDFGGIDGLGTFFRHVVLRLVARSVRDVTMVVTRAEGA